MDTMDCDVLIIGSGAGGATVGHTLAENGRDVLMLEEGPHVPAEAANETLSDSFQSIWRAGGMTMAFGKPPTVYAEGRCVGGSTEINSAIFQRAPHALLDVWAERYRIDTFSPAVMEGLYDDVARLVNASTTPGPLGPPSDLLLKAAEAKNWRALALERGQKNCVGTNNCSLGCPTGAKQSMSTTLLRSFVQNGGRILPETRALKLEYKSGKVTSVLVSSRTPDGATKRIRIQANHVFVSGGAIQTPALLQKSGLGRGVGAGFKLHPTIRALAEFDEPVDAPNHRLPLYAITEFLPDVRIGGSVFTLPTYSMFLAEDWAARGYMAPAWRNMVMYYAMARGTGAGKVSSLPFLDAPITRYGLSDEDWTHLAFGLTQLCSALFDIGARRIQPSIAGMPAWRTMDDVEKALANGLPRGKSNLMTIHLFSSVRIGENDKVAGTSSYGRLHGLENLYIADASLIPEAPGVNPQATVMALALRNARAFLDRTPGA